MPDKSKNGSITEKMLNEKTRKNPIVGLSFLQRKFQVAWRNTEIKIRVKAVEFIFL